MPDEPGIHKIDVPASDPDDDGAELVVEIDVPEGTSDEGAIATIAGLSLMLDDMHRGFGGHGLRVKRIEAEDDDDAR